MKVSVVIPAYNASKTIGQCLQALDQQSYPKDQFEVIVVDDGSTDNTAAIIKKFAVQYIHQENQGPATARNKGAATACGALLLFTDSDCIPTGEWVAEMVAPFDNPQVMAVKGGYLSRQRQLVARFVQIEFEERFALLEKAGKTDMIDTYSAGYRRHIFDSLHGFDIRFPVANNEDTELSYRMANEGFMMVFAPQAVVYHLGHPDSLLRYARLKFSRGYWRMVVYKKFPEKMLKDTYTPKTLKIQILTLCFMLLSLPLFGFYPVVAAGVLGVNLLVFIGSSFSFIITALRKDLGVGFCSPFLLATRALALGLGAVCGSIYGRI